MSALLKCGAMFYHIPKTGGNWVSDVLEKHNLVFAYLGGKHSIPDNFLDLERMLRTPQKYSKINRELFNFCFVRHPLRWYESWYKMNLPMDWPNWESNSDVFVPIDKLNGLGADSFNDFISNVLNKRPGFVTAMYGLYTGRCDFVGKQEKMANDLVRVFSFLNTKVNIDNVTKHPRVNVSKRIDVTWDAKQQAEMEEAEFDAFVRYGYKTEIYRSIDTFDLESIPSSLDYFEKKKDLHLPYQHNGGFAWTTSLGGMCILSDSEEFHRRSLLVLYENGKPLKMPHSTHSDIREQGCGLYSHWKDLLYFSTSDNTDPNTNGRRYQIGIEFTSSMNDPALLLQRGTEHAQ